MLSRPSATASAPDTKSSVTDLGDAAVAVFVFATVFFPEGTSANTLARMVLIGVFGLGVASGSRLTFNPFLVAAAGFLAVSAASLTWTVAPVESGDRVSTLAFQFVSFVALINLMSWKRTRLELGFTWVILGAICSGLYVTVIQGVTFQDVREVEGTVAAGQLALACAAGMAVSIYRLAKTRQQRYLLYLAALSTFLLMTSGRRGLLLISFFFVFFLIVSSPSLGSRIRSIAVGAAVLALGYVAIVRIPLLHDFVGSRLESFIGAIFSGETGDASTQGRRSLISFGYDQFQQSPLIGNGIDSFRALFARTHGSWDTSADNNYVELLADLGLLGLLAYYVPLILFLARRIRGVTSSPVEMRFAIAWILAMSVTDFATVWPFSKVGMLMVALCYQAQVRQRCAPTVATETDVRS